MMNKIGIAVFDLDSTIADTSPRHHLSPFVNSNETWYSYAEACSADKPMLGTIAVVRLLFVAGLEIHILTGRRSTAREQTKAWLDTHGVPWHVLRMREDSDLEPNSDYKIDYMKNLPELPVLFVSDWSPECQAVRKILGIPSVCINPEYNTSDGPDDPTMSKWATEAPSLLDNK